MRWTLAIAVAAALAATAAAVAHAVTGRASHTVAGTFAATAASRIQSHTCTTADGKTITTTTGTYTGTASGDPDLTGAATITARSTINSTDGIGIVSGTLRIDPGSGRRTVTSFNSVYSGGQIAGLAVGRAHAPAADLVANVSASFSASGGFTDGKIGGSVGGAAVEVAGVRCSRVQVVHERSDASGVVSTVSSTSITVAGLTCAVPSNLQARVARFAQGSHAAIRCRLENGANTLVGIERRR
jgi:hypothetical protein